MAQATNDTAKRTRTARKTTTAPKPASTGGSTAVDATPRPRTRGKGAVVVVPEPVTALAPAPAERTLDELEAIIEKGKLAFIEVGQALLEIRERNLYKGQGFQTFEDYCQQRWDFGRKRGYQLAEAAKLASEVDVRGLPERSVRELAPLRHEPAQAQAAVDEASAAAKAQGRQKPTAEEIKKAVARRRPAPGRADDRAPGTPPRPRSRRASRSGRASRRWSGTASWRRPCARTRSWPSSSKPSTPRSCAAPWQSWTSSTRT